MRSEVLNRYSDGWRRAQTSQALEETYHSSYCYLIRCQRLRSIKAARSSGILPSKDILIRNIILNDSKRNDAVLDDIEEINRLIA